MEFNLSEIELIKNTVGKGANVLLDKNLFIEDNASLTVPEMTSMCRRLKKITN